MIQVIIQIFFNNIFTVDFEPFSRTTNTSVFPFTGSDNIIEMSVDCIRGPEIFF